MSRSATIALIALVYGVLLPVTCGALGGSQGWYWGGAIIGLGVVGFTLVALFAPEDPNA